VEQKKMLEGQWQRIAFDGIEIKTKAQEMEVDKDEGFYILKPSKSSSNHVRR
jgi:hypothetical protein